MKVITNRQIIFKGQDKNSNACGCSSATGETSNLPSSVSTTSPDGKTKSGMLWDKAKGTWVKASDWLNAHPEFKAKAEGALGQIFGNILDTIGLGGTKGSAPAPTVMPSYTPDPTPQPAKKGLSRNAKIGIGIGAGVLVLAAVYFATKGKKTGK